MPQAKMPSYFRDIEKNLTSEDREQLQEQSQEYLNRRGPDIGVRETIERESLGELQSQIWEAQQERAKRTNSNQDDNGVIVVSPKNFPRISLQDITDELYEEYQLGGRNDLEMELDPLVIEEAGSSVKQLHVLISTTEADHQRFLYQLNSKLRSSA